MSIDALCRAVDAGAMMNHLQQFARWIKLSGTADELKSFEYLRLVLDGCGYQTALLQHDAYISLPGAARLDVGGEAPRCITHSFSRSSPPGGLSGKLVFAASGAEADFATTEVRGSIVLLAGIATPGATLRASRAGAIGQIHISPHEHIHEMCISSIWGSPGVETLEQLPCTVVVSVAKAEGDKLRARLEAGDMLEATIHAEVDTRWRETPLLVAELMPESGGEGVPFVMISGHHDTWHYGVMDNGSANATMLEVARLLASRRGDWRRGLRLCFWSGHSHGRYSGSAWYADTHWSELERRCVVHVNVDSTGGRGNVVLADTPASSELLPLAREAVSVRGGQELDDLRMARAGDQSFWGVGIPSIFMGMGEQPAGLGKDAAVPSFASGVRKKGAGFGWWWHTPDDTLDKIDPELLVRDTQIYVHAIWRLVTDTILPFDYAVHAARFRKVLEKLGDELGERFDLHPLMVRVDAVENHARSISARASSDDVSIADPVNRMLMRAGRALVPLDYTRGDRFIHDPALPLAPYPALDALRVLAAINPSAEEAKFAAVDAQRAANRVAHALDLAIAALDPDLVEKPSTAQRGEAHR